MGQPEKSFVACLSTDIHVLILGDLNAWHSLWDAAGVSDPFGSNLVRFCSDRSLSVLNSVFCRDQCTFPQSNSTVDLAITSAPNLFPKMAVLSDSGLVSDHFPIVVH